MPKKKNSATLQLLREIIPLFEKVKTYKTFDTSGWGYNFNLSTERELKNIKQRIKNAIKRELKP